MCVAFAKKSNIPPIYMVEVFTKPGVNPEAAKKYIFEKTGMVPGIYENGTLSNVADAQRNI